MTLLMYTQILQIIDQWCTFSTCVQCFSYAYRCHAPFSLLPLRGARRGADALYAPNAFPYSAPLHFSVSFVYGFAPANIMCIDYVSCGVGLSSSRGA